MKIKVQVRGAILNEIVCKKQTISYKNKERMKEMKFCKKCGSQLSGDSRFCEDCGEHVAAAVQTTEQTNQTHATPNLMQPQYQQAMPQTTAHKYDTLGGWLLVIMILNIIMTLRNIVTATDELQASIAVLLDGWYVGAMIVNIVAQAIALTSIAFTVVFIVQVFQRKSSFLKFSQIGQILIAMSILINLLVMVMIGLDNFESGVFTDNISSLGGACIGFFVQAQYYCKSIRVRTYMNSDEYIHKALFTYKNNR